MPTSSIRGMPVAGPLTALYGRADEGPITVTSDPGLQFRAVDAVVDLVALHTPLVIGLDDLQWADPSSLLTISTIGRRLADLPVALIGCYRPAPRSPQLERTVEFLRAASAQELSVGPLGEYAVVELVAEMVPAECGETYNLIVSRGVLALIFFHRNDLARVEQTAEVAVRQLAATGARYRAQWAMCAQALVLKAQGKIAEAYATSSESWDFCADLGLALEYRVLGPELVRLALAVGDRERAGVVSAAVAQLAAGNNLPSLTGTAFALPGIGRRRSGDPERGCRRLRAQCAASGTGASLRGRGRGFRSTAPGRSGSAPAA